MALERSIDLGLVKGTKPGTKGRITLRNLFKELFQTLNVSYSDSCCDDVFAGACPAISEDAGNLLECREDGLYASAESIPFITSAGNGLTSSSGQVVLGEDAFSGSGASELQNDREIILGDYDLYLTSTDGSQFAFATYPNSEMQFFGYAATATTKLSIVMSNFAGAEVQFYKQPSGTGNATYLVNTTGNDFIIGDVGGVGTTADIIFQARGVDRFVIDGDQTFRWRNLTVNTMALSSVGVLTATNGYVAPGTFGYGVNGSPSNVFGVNGQAGGHLNLNANGGNLRFNSFGDAAGDFGYFDAGDYTLHIQGRLATDGGVNEWGFAAVTTAAAVLDATRYANVIINGTPTKLAIIV